MNEIDNLFENNSKAENIQWIKNLEKQMIASGDGFKALTAERDLLKKVVSKILLHPDVRRINDIVCGDLPTCCGITCGSDACIELHIKQVREGK